MSEETLFHDARHLAAADRAAFLDANCADPEMRRRVDGLLKSHDAAGGALDQPAVTGAFTPLPDDSEARAAMIEQPGDRIGQYKLLQKLGEGGMGSVWTAEQSEPVKRRVALKLIKAGMDSSQVLRRFEAERQALALMEHQNIAKVLDAGTTPQGRPFFAMELIKGLPITKYCDQEHLSPRERLELFIPVCQAVQHAHQKGVIHRDLKPSNVLIALYDGKPVPKVIDFGVAKATSQKLTERTMYTEVGQIVGTLEYMAPEQAELNNLDIDTRADIYSLGVILYELLAGSPPFTAKQLRGAAFTEMLRLIREVEPPKPSTRISSSDELPSIAANRKLEPNRLTRMVHGDLDWIVMKALEKDRGRRYETANGFAMDIQHYLADEPVLAGPPGAGYRLRKLVRRNKGPVLAGTAVALALVAGVSAVLLVQAKANHELTAANQQLAEANKREREANARTAARFDLAMDAIATFHTGVSEDLLLKQKEFESLRKKLLNGAADFYRKLQTQHGNDPDPRSRAALARAYAGLGEMDGKVGATGQALRDYAEARALYEALITEAPSDPAPRRELVRILNETAYMHRDRKEPAEQRQAATQAVEDGERLVALSPDVPEHKHLLARALITLGQTSSDAPAEEERLYGRAIAILEPLVAAHPKIMEYRKQLGRAFGSLANVAYNKGRHEECLRLSAKDAEICEAIYRADPTDLNNRRNLAINHDTEGMALSGLGRTKESLEEYCNALQLLEELTIEQPAVIEYQQAFAREHQNVGSALGALGRMDEALDICRKQVAVLDRLVTRHPDRPELKNRLAFGLWNTGATILYLGHADEALADYRRAEQLWEELVKLYPAELEYGQCLRAIWTGLGELLADTGRTGEATAAYERARDVAETLAKAHATDPWLRSSLVNCWATLGSHLGRLGHPADGLAALIRARELAEQLAADLPNEPYYRSLVGLVFVDIALVLRDAGDEAGSVAAGERALAIRQRLAAEFPKSVGYRECLANSLSQIGLSYQRAGRPTEARAALGRCREICEQLAAEIPKNASFQDNLGRALANLGYLEALAGDPAAALPLHQKAVAIREQVVNDHPKNTEFQRGLGYSLTYLGQTYRRLGRRAEAGPALERALALVEPLIKLRTQIALVQALQLETRLELGMLRFAEARPEEAAAHFARALQAAADRPEPSMDELVLQVGIHAQLSRLADAAVAAALPGKPDAAANAKGHADQAMALLTRAVAKGFGDRFLVTKSDAYDPLRERDDFKKLLADLETKAKSGAK